MNSQQAVMMDESRVELVGEAPVAYGPRAAARLIAYASECYFALPIHTTLEIIENPVVVTVPGAAYYTCGMLAWQGHYLPVIDICTLLRAYQDTPIISTPRYALVVAYQRASGSPIEHGALGLTVLPQTIEVGDEAWCELPASSDLWPSLSLSCLRHNGAIAPILDTAKLFMAYHG